MKKLFLTSGIIACMACPAFADPVTPTGFPGAGDPIVVPSGPQTGACVEGVLGTTSGDVQLQAQWDAVWHTITLNVNSANGGSTNGAPTPMYSIEGDNTVYRTRTGNSNADFAFSNNVAANATLLTSPAAGIYVNHTLTLGLPGGWTAQDLSTSASSTQQQRAFNGYFSDATGGTQYTDGVTLLTDGANAARNANDDQIWYAQYACATPTLIDPALPGYRFDGWTRGGLYNETTNPYLVYDIQTGQNDFCINESDTLYANWTALNQTITYSCGTKPAGATTNISGNAPGNETVATDATYTLATLGAGECSLPGYEFAGWDCPNLPNGTANDDGYYDAGTQGSFHYVGTITCTAKWKQGSISLHWDANNATAVVSIHPSSLRYAETSGK